MIKRGLKEGVVYGIMGGLSRLTGVVLTPIYTRVLSEAHFGLLDLYTTLLTLIYIITETEIVSGFMRSYYEYRETHKVRSLLGSATLYYVLSTLLIVVAMLLFQPHLGRWVPRVNAKIIWLIIAGNFPAQLFQLGLAVLRLEHDIKHYCMYTVAQVWTAAFLGVLAVLLLDAGVVGIIAGIILSRVIFIVPLIRYIRRYVRIRFSMRQIKELVIYGAPIVPAVLGGWMQQYISRFFILTVLPLSLLGIYSLASKVGSIFFVIIMAFRLAWSPYEMKYYTQANSEPFFARALVHYYFITLIAAVMFSVCSPLVVHILAPESYREAIYYVPALILGFLWQGSLTILSVGNNWARKTYYNTFGYLGGGLLSVGILYYAIDAFQLFAAAGAFLLCMIVTAYMVFWTAQKNHRIPYASSLLHVMAILSLALFAIPFLASRWNIVRIWIMNLSFLIVGITGLMILWWRYYSVEERRVIRESIMFVKRKVV